jgi:hypothetical protein
MALFSQQEQTTSASAFVTINTAPLRRPEGTFLLTNQERNSVDPNYRDPRVFNNSGPTGDILRIKWWSLFRKCYVCPYR